MEMSDKGSLTWRVTPDLLGILDAAGRFRDTNPAWRTTLGLGPEDIENRMYLELIHPDDIAPSRAIFESLQAGRPILGFENRYRHADGSYRWLSWNAVPADDLFFCTGRDVTAHKSSQAALRDSTAEAALREQFIAVLGHDLRNPLAALSSGVNILRRKYASEDDDALMDAMQGSVMRMTRLIDDVMDFTRVRLGDGILRQNKQSIVLTPTLEETTREIRMGHPDVVIEESFDFNEPVLCEGPRISQLLSNLLSNAIAHGDPGKPILVRAYADNGDFVLTVENAGDPIPEAMRPLLFSPFARGNQHEFQNGLGLGLFIVAEIARGHGGALTFTSDAERTVFTLRIPKGEMTHIAPDA